ncbi:hypothetical protein ACWEP3_22285 [Streptomyces albidoflavus]
MSTDPAAAPADEDAPAPQAAAPEDAPPPEHGPEETRGEAGDGETPAPSGQEGEAAAPALSEAEAELAARAAGPGSGCRTPWRPRGRRA